MKDAAGKDKDVKDRVMVPYPMPREKDDAERVRQTAGNRQHYRDIGRYVI